MAELRGSGVRWVDRLGQTHVGSIGGAMREFHRLDQAHRLDRVGTGAVPRRSSQGLVGAPVSVG
jgi:hypothetical protein